MSPKRQGAADHETEKRELRNRISYLRRALREQAVDHHDYRRERQPDERYGHQGGFEECPTMRCEGVRRVLDETA